MSTIFIAGHNGMVGAAICQQLASKGIEVITANRDKLDLTDQAQVKDFFNNHEFSQVYLAAAKVGGIYANDTYPAEFIYQNLMIQCNVINSAYQSGVKKLLFLGSSCIYPKHAEQPINENELLNGHLEPTNEPYAIAKISGIKMCESYNRQYGVSYRSVMPTNLYGPGDNFHPDNSHVIPALIKRFHNGKVHKLPEVSVWGSGTPMREFLHVDDMANASIRVMNLSILEYKRHTSDMLSHINVGYGEDISIKELAQKIAKVINYKGQIVFDSSKPDGASQKLMSSELINILGWKPSIDLENGLRTTYDDFLLNHNS